MTPPHCAFCPWPVATTLRRQRRALSDVALRRPAPEVHICAEHLGKGLDHIRSARLGLAAGEAAQRVVEQAQRRAQQRTQQFVERTQWRVDRAQQIVERAQQRGRQIVEAARRGR